MAYVTAVDTVPSPKEFYDTYVQPRRPVLFRRQCGLILGRPTLRSDLTISNLRALATAVSTPESSSKASDDSKGRTVEVNEHRPGFQPMSTTDTPSTNTPPAIPLTEPTLDTKTSEPPSDSKPRVSFSPAEGSRVREMRWTDYLDHLQAASTPALYMTTQTLPLDEEGRPAVTTWLAEALIARGLLPLRPSLLGHLIPMNAANLWMGRSTVARARGDDAQPESANPTPTEASSSGLHHDFHDNLYCLVRGRKSIRLAPPRVIHNVQMVGTIHTVHSNGRIVYLEQLESTTESHPSTNTDEADCPIRPDGALATVERIVQLELRKEAAEQALETLTSDDAADDRDRLEQELNDIEEQLLDIEMENAPNEDDGNSDDDDEDSDTGVFFGGADNRENDTKLPAKRRKLSEPNTAANRTPQLEQGQANEVESRVDVATPKVPPNFVLAVNKPVEFETVEMDEGDVLYLPAGWFHEVFSRGNYDGITKVDDGIHLAVNYWVHPPDVGTDTSFTKPYRSLFWQRDWDARNLHQMF